MFKQREQMKFTVDSDIASVFRARCAAEGASMTSVISQWMDTGSPVKATTIKLDTRPHRKKAVLELIVHLGSLLQKEEEYRDAIPENFQSKYEAADQACGQLEQAISYLEDAY